MTKRMLSALGAAVLLFASLSLTTNADARSDSSNGGGSSRSCLTSSARGLLARIESKFGPMRIVSTCRSGATIAGTGRISRHASGNAIDFSAGNRKGAVVSWLIANHRSGGTMTYPGMDHIHVDIGQHFVSLAGSRRYASNARSSKRAYASNSRSSKRDYASNGSSDRMALGGPMKAGWER